MGRTTRAADPGCPAPRGRPSGRRRAVRLGAALLAVTAVVGCQPGDPDTAFGTEGTVHLVGRTGGATVAPAPDGGVVAMPGDGLGPVRLRPDGTTDEAWGTPSPVPCPGATIHRDAAAGYVAGCDGPPAAVVRWTVAGDLDPAFGDGGVVTLPDVPGASGRAAVVPVPGGGFLAARARVTGDPAAPVELTLARLAADGTVTPLPPVAVDSPDLPPPDITGRWAASVVAAPTAGGALVAVNPGFVLDVNFTIGSAATVLRLDADGDELGRFAGPAPAGELGTAVVTALAELPDGRLALAATGEGARWVGSRPYPADEFTLMVTSATGERLTSMSEEPGTNAPRVTSLLGTAGGRRLWTAGARFGGDGVWHHDVVRYETDTLGLDGTFGLNGTIMVDGATGLSRRLGGPAHVYVGGQDDVGTTQVTRVWGQSP